MPIVVVAYEDILQDSAPAPAQYSMAQVLLMNLIRLRRKDGKKNPSPSECNMGLDFTAYLYGHIVGEEAAGIGLCKSGVIGGTVAQIMVISRGQLAPDHLGHSRAQKYMGPSFYNVSGW